MAALIKFTTVCRHWPRIIIHRADRFKDRIAGIGRQNSTNFRQYSTKNVWEVDTNVSKDVVLYVFENSKFHKYLNIFAITQFGFWLYLAEFSMSTLKDVPINKEQSENKELPWYRKINMGENKFRTGITTLCLMVGGSWMYSLKSVRAIVLRKGGNDVTFITHAPFNKMRYLDAPLKNVSATQSRTHGAIIQLPLKVKGYMGYFLIDMKGEFKNGPLFDATCGLKRILNK
nr:EOG090X0JX7 [Eurycercus lamellatus]